MPISLSLTTVLPIFLNIGGYRLDAATKDLIRKSGGKTYIQRINGETFEFVHDPFGYGVVKRSLKTGKYWTTYDNKDYYYDLNHKTWVNPITYTAFEDEYPELAKELKLKKDKLVLMLKQYRFKQPSTLEATHTKGVLDKLSKSLDRIYNRVYYFFYRKMPPKAVETPEKQEDNTNSTTWYAGESNAHKSSKLNINWPLVLHPLDDIPYGRIFAQMSKNKAV